MRDDTEFNVRLCEEVWRNPCLYDDTQADYCNKSAVDTVWKTIAKKFNETAFDCKERWKNIRGRYGKYKIAQSKPGAKPVKKYYLAVHLQFLDEFLKPRKPKGSLAGGESTILEHPLVSDGECDDGEEDNVSIIPSPELIMQEQLENVKLPPQQVCGENLGRKRKATTPLDDANEHACRSCGNNQERTHEKVSVDADMAFLQSVLPDMKAMNARQKRKFKMAILNLTEQILDPDVHHYGPTVPVECNLNESIKSE